MRILLAISIVLLCVGCENASPEAHYDKFVRTEAEERVRANKTEQDSVKPKPTETYVSDDRAVPLTLYGHSGEQEYTAYNFYHNGIRYLGVFLENESMNAAAVVDYSQFFDQDTVVVGGRTWVSVRTEPTETKE